MLDLLASLHSLLHSQRTRSSCQNNSRCRRDDGNSLSRRLGASLLPTLLTLFAAAVLCTNAGAQVRFGSVVGTVADASGADRLWSNRKADQSGYERDSHDAE